MATLDLQKPATTTDFAARGAGESPHVAIDGTALYPPFGGVEYSLWNLLTALRDLDTPHRFTVYVPHDGPQADFGANWTWHRLPFDGSAKLRRIRWQQTELSHQLLRDKCDLLHAPTYVSPLRCPVPVVLGVYDLIALTHPHFATKLNRLHYSLVLPHSLRRAAQIIVPSDVVGRDVKTFAPQAKVNVVPLGLEDDFLREVSDAEIQQTRAEMKLPQKYILWVGNFEPKKNLPLLLRAHDLLCQRLSDAPPLVIAGGARAWDGHEIAGDGTRRIFLGYTERRHLPALFAGCAAFVFPTLAEGFCLPVLEALGAGAPVITSPAVPLPNLETVAEIADPHDDEALSQRIEALLAQPERAAQLRQRGRDYARTFTWRRAALQTLNVYAQAVRTF
jgi:glycosyltransferase involved in cell wall biosynthesis